MVADELRVMIRAETRQAVNQMRRAQKQTGDLHKAALKMVAGFASVGAAMRMLQREFRQSIRAWADLEAAQTRVAAAAELNGEHLQTVIPQYHALAAEIQELTVVSDSATLEMIALAQSMGVTSRDMDQVVRGAIGLSRTFGIDTQQAIRMVTNALEGNFTQLERYLPQVRNAQTESEKMAAVQQAMATGFEMAQAEINTVAGRMARYENAVSDVREEIGRFLTGNGQNLLTWATDLAQRTAGAIEAINELREAYRADAEGVATAQQRLIVLQDKLGQELERQARVSTQARQERIDQIELEIAGVRAVLRAEEERAAREAVTLESQRRAVEESKKRDAERQKFIDKETAAKIRLAELEYEMLSPAEQRLRTVQQEINEWDKKIQAAKEANREYSEMQRVFEALARERDRLREEIAAGDEPQIIDTDKARDELLEAQRLQEEHNARVREDFDRMTESQIDAIHRRRDEFIAAGVDEVRANRWATEQIAAEYARMAQQAISAVSQIHSATMGLWSQMNAARDQRAQNEIANIRAELREMEDRHEREIAFAEAAGATEQELAVLRKQHLEDKQRAKEDADERERELLQKQFKREQSMRAAQTAMAGAQAVVNALATVQPTIPAGVAAAALIGTMYAAQVAKIRAQEPPAFERGGSFVTSGPQMIMVGDGQSPRERVTVEPLSGPYRRGGSPITININGVIGGREAVANWVHEGIIRGRERGKIRGGV